MVQFLKGSLVRGHYKELYIGLELSVECSKSPGISDQFREDSTGFSSPLWPNPSLFFSFGGVPNQFSTLQIFPSAFSGDQFVSASRPGCHNRPDSTRTRHPHREDIFASDFWRIFHPPVEADPRVEYNFLGMASGLVKQIKLQK